jgi:uncharacterized membrane protein YkoI
MKKLLIPLTLCTVITFTSNAQKMAASKVPDLVKESFKKQFPAATAKWEKEDGKYEAEFKENGHAMSALFDSDGKMTESEIEIKVSQLPATTIAYIKEHYKGLTIKEAAKITKADGTVVYEAEINKKDVLFYANGKFLREVKY